jgi:purine-binding chemotaxis protein CheW
MVAACDLLVFALDEQRFALPLEVVDRVVRAVEIVPLPGAPLMVSGVINVHGEILPVINLRVRCGLPDREIDLDDQFIIAHTPSRTVALHVDSTQVIHSKLEECVATDHNVPDCVSVKQMVKGSDQLILVYSIESLLTPEDDHILGTVLIQAAGSSV